VSGTPPSVTVLVPCEFPKLVPVITKPIWIGPWGSEMPLIYGVTANGTPLLAVSPTVTTTFPVVAPVGTETVMLVALQQVLHGVASVPSNVTVLVPCVAPKFTPEIVTGEPIGPAVGDRFVMFGPDPTTNQTPLLALPPTVTTTFPEVAPLGTGTVILLPVELQFVGIAGVVLNVTVLVPCVAPKFTPVIVTGVLTDPESGLKEMMAGPEVGSKTEQLLDIPPTVTTTHPTVALDGTFTTILVGPHVVTEAEIPLNVTTPAVEPKFVPVIVTDVPGEPEVALKLVMDGGGKMTEKLTPLLAIPPTVTTTGPLVAPLGTVTAMLLELHVATDAGVPLNVTVLVPWVVPKLSPLTVTAAPVLPEAGFKPVIPGPDPTTKMGPLLDSPPTVTTTLPVVAPGGTGVTMLVEVQVAGLAKTPLKVTLLVPCEEPKFVPVIVTEVFTFPEFGLRFVIDGDVPTTKRTPLLRIPPTVTTTFPVVAPVGTDVVMLAAPQNVGVAITPLNVTVLDP
jgi:hypothetical protein